MEGVWLPVQKFQGLFIQCFKWFKCFVFLLACAKLVKQYVRCDIIIAFIYNFAASVVIEFLINRILNKLNLTLWHTFFFTWDLKNSWESIRMPRDWNSETTCNFSPDNIMACSGVARRFFEKKNMLLSWCHIELWHDPVHWWVLCCHVRKSQRHQRKAESLHQSTRRASHWNWGYTEVILVQILVEHQLEY